MSANVLIHGCMSEMACLLVHVSFLFNTYYMHVRFLI